MKQLYLHPKAQTALGERRAPLVRQILSLVAAPLVPRRRLSLEERTSAIQAQERIERLRARGQFERGGLV